MDVHLIPCTLSFASTVYEDEPWKCTPHLISVSLFMANATIPNDDSVPLVVTEILLCLLSPTYMPSPFTSQNIVPLPLMLHAPEVHHLS